MCFKFHNFYILTFIKIEIKKIMIKDFLFEGENIEFEHKTFYVTNKRVIEFKKSLSGDVRLKDIGFKHLTSIEITRDYNELILVMGLLVLTLAFLLNLFFILHQIIIGAMIVFGLASIIVVIALPVQTIVFIGDNEKKISYKYKNLKQAQNLDKLVRKFEDKFIKE